MVTAGLTLEGGGAAGVEAALLCVLFRRDGLEVPGSRHVLAGVQRVKIGRGSEPTQRTAEGGGTLLLNLADERASGAHAELEYVRGGWVLSDVGSRNGTWLDGARIERASLVDGAIVEVGTTFLCFRAPTALPPGLPADTAEDALASPSPLWRTFNPQLGEVYGRLARLARTDLAVLVQGPTGAGKERVAEGLHALSGRTGPLHAVNCATLDAGLADATLFGHVRGAFTGAVGTREGLFAQADGGTVFLDEVGELPAAVQAKLLRVLETGTMRPVGSDQARQVNVRVVAATHRSLDTGTFREDLYARLASYVAPVPPLADRREDLGLLLRALLERPAPALSRDATWALVRHDWPRNVRELRDALRVAQALGEGRIEASHLPAGLQGETVAPAGAKDPRHVALIEALEATRGNVAEAARRLGKSRNTTHKWLRQFDVDPERYRG